MTADVHAIVARQELQKAQREKALRVLLERPHMPPRHRTAVLLVAELVTRPGCTAEAWAQLLGVTSGTARGYVRDLVTWGVLEEPPAGWAPAELRLVTP